MPPSHINGPSVVSPLNVHPENGPSAIYQGFGITDVRQRYHPGATGVGTIPVYLDAFMTEVLRVAPSAAGAAKVAAAATATSGTALTLLTTQTASAAPNAPFLPIGAAQSGIVKALMLEPGFTVASTTSGSATATISGIAAFPFIVPGLKVAVAAGSAGTWVLTTVKSVSGTSVVFDQLMGATTSTAAVAIANGSFREGVAPAYITPFRPQGVVAPFSAIGGVARGVSVTSNNAGDTGWTLTVSGYDQYGAAMSEAIAVTANSTAYGKKAFKFIASAVPTKGGGGTSTGTLSVGTSDVIGLPLRSDNSEDVLVHWAGALLTASTGWLVADTTSPATTTTGDVRGTFQLGTLGGGTGATNSTDGTRKLVVRQLVPAVPLGATTKDNFVPMFGVTQV
jgi:hypothetical protein